MIDSLTPHVLSGEESAYDQEAAHHARDEHESTEQESTEEQFDPWRFEQLSALQTIRSACGTIDDVDESEEKNPIEDAWRTTRLSAAETLSRACGAASDSESENEIEAPSAPGPRRETPDNLGDMARLLLRDLVDEPMSRSRDYFPKYPILRYLVVGAEEQQAVAAPGASYEDALALNEFVAEFVSMLQRGFRVLLYEGDLPPRAHTLSLSEDCTLVSWRALYGENGVHRPSHFVALARVTAVVDTPPFFATIPADREARCFAMAFQKNAAPVVVFETVNEKTKELLVDGFKLLVKHAVSKFFTSSEFRVPADLRKEKNGAEQPESEQEEQETPLEVS